MAGNSKGKTIFDFSLLKRVFQYAKPYKTKFILSVVMAILLAVVSPIRPWLIQVTINEHVQHGALAPQGQPAGVAIVDQMSRFQQLFAEQG